MARRGRPGGLSANQRQVLWEQWQAGQSLSEISRLLCQHPGSIHRVLSTNGGIAPQSRSRSSRHLTLSERETIFRGIAAGLSLRRIAKQLDRPVSTVSREVARHGGRGQYRASTADEAAWEQAKRPKVCHLATVPQLRELVAEKLSLQWSPEQISGWLKLRFPGDRRMQVSHETIYRSLYIQARGVLKKELMQHLRSRRMMRRSKHAESQPRGQIKDAVSIRERPPEAEDRAIPGHWEGDLITGAKNSHIATLVERHSRFTMLVQVEGKDTTSVIAGLIREAQRLPDALKGSLTWDRGTELAAHKDFTVATDIKVYFCDPQSPWQRGTNENTNRLLRQYYPKGMDLSTFTQQDLDQVAMRLNERPRKTLGYKTPAEVLSTTVALTG
ncbi:IS30 family transposase [Halomonas salifodinae]|uniref:IS30 family transposase n=1 Tax=Halomonas salifodinae TaxID=438745 RepID=UPI0033BC310F